MKIERMNKGSWGKVRAFFDLTTTEGFTIKGFKIIEGINGLFVSMPSQKGTNQQGEDEWFDTIWVEKELRDKLNQLAVESYGSQFKETLDNSNVEKTEQSSDTPEPKKMISNEINEEFIKKEEGQDSAKQPFSDDDIPF